MTRQLYLLDALSYGLVGIMKIERFLQSEEDNWK
jgi:hypothetical protein